jgi:hypothetical protein
MSCATAPKKSRHCVRPSAIEGDGLSRVKPSFAQRLLLTTFAVALTCQCVRAAEFEPQPVARESQRSTAPLAERFAWLGKGILDAGVLEAGGSSLKAIGVRAVAPYFQLNAADGSEATFRLVAADSAVRVRLKNGLHLHCDVDASSEPAAEPELQMNFALRFEFK